MSLQRCRFQSRSIATALSGFAPNCQFRAAATGCIFFGPRKLLIVKTRGLISLFSLFSHFSHIPLFFDR